MFFTDTPDTPDTPDVPTDVPLCTAWLRALPLVRRQRYEYELDVCDRLPKLDAPRLPPECDEDADMLLFTMETMLEDNLRAMITENVSLDRALTRDALCMAALETVLPEMLLNPAAHYAASHRLVSVYYDNGADNIDRVGLQEEQSAWAPAAAALAAQRFQHFYTALRAFVLSKPDTPLCWATADDIVRAVARTVPHAAMVQPSAAFLAYTLHAFADNQHTSFLDETSNDLAMERGQEFLELLDTIPRPAVTHTELDMLFARPGAEVETHLCQLFKRERADSHVLKGFVRRHLGIAITASGAYSVPLLVHHMLASSALRELHMRPPAHAFASRAVKSSMALRKLILDTFQMAHGSGSAGIAFVNGFTNDALCQALRFLITGIGATVTCHTEKDDFAVLASYVALAAKLKKSQLKTSDLRESKLKVNREDYLPLASAMAAKGRISLGPYFKQTLVTANSKKGRRTLNSYVIEADPAESACYVFCGKESPSSVIAALQPLRAVLVGRAYDITPERVHGLSAARAALQGRLHGRVDAVRTALAFGAMTPLMLARAATQQSAQLHHVPTHESLRAATALVWQAARAARAEVLDLLAYEIAPDAGDVAAQLCACAVCGEPHLPMFDDGCAAHPVCTPCAVRCVEARAVDVALRRAWHSTADMLQCPMGGACTGSVPAQLLALLGPDMRYVVEVLGAEPAPLADAQRCFQCWDSVARCDPAAGVVANCRTCLAQMCTVCGSAAHPGWLCQAVAGTVTPEVVLSEAKTQPCPQCGVATMKDAGCNHITCLCKASWCWLCSSVLPANVDTAAHYAAGASLCGQFAYNVQFETERMRRAIHARTDIPDDVKSAALLLLESTHALKEDDI